MLQILNQHRITIYTIIKPLNKITFDKNINNKAHYTYLMTASTYYLRNYVYHSLIELWMLLYIPLREFQIPMLFSIKNNYLILSGDWKTGRLIYYHVILHPDF